MIKEEKKAIDTYVSIETGECIEIYEGTKVKVTHKEQQEAMRKSFDKKRLNEELEEWNKELGGFVFVLFKYCNNMLEQHKEITPEDITKLFYLSTYVNYEGYLIFKRKYMTRKDMSDLLNIHRNGFNSFFNKMNNIGLFLIDDIGIKINKEYFSKGEIEKEIKKNYNYTRLYIQSIQYLYKNVSIRKHKQLGNYFKLIPYVHRQQNILCFNPECDTENIKAMNVNDVRDLLGYTTKGVKKIIDDLVEIKLENDESIFIVIVRSKNQGKSLILVNPKVIYGGNFDITETEKKVLNCFKGELV